MHKGQAQNEAFATRSGSMSTRASRKGRNLLGWGEEEKLTPSQQLHALRAAATATQERLRDIKVEFTVATDARHEDSLKALRKERGQCVDKLAFINEEIAKLKPQAGVVRYPELSEEIIALVKQRLTTPEWKILLAEAHRNYDLKMAACDQQKENEDGTR